MKNIRMEQSVREKIKKKDNITLNMT